LKALRGVWCIQKNFRKKSEDHGENGVPGRRLAWLEEDAVTHRHDADWRANKPH
jgi:hypothetical protein